MHDAFKTNRNCTEANSLSLTAAIIIPLVGYQFVLCFLNTNLFAVSNALVATTETVLLCLMAWHVWPLVRPPQIAGLAFLSLYFALLATIRGHVDLAGPRNVAIILLSYALGKSYPCREGANKLIWIISAIVLFCGGFEYFFTDFYYRFFDVLHYYIARGEVSESVQTWVKQNSYVSGFRPAGRNILPILGDIRISSIFLEPVSMGNYAVIVCIWALSFPKEDWVKGFWHFAVSLILVVGCDSRFASILILVLLVLRFIPGLTRKPVILVMPVLATAFLILFSYFELGSLNEDNLPGRLMHSGAAIINLNVPQILGFGDLEFLGDMGIAYSLEYFGIVLCIVLWTIFARRQLQDVRGRQFRLLLATYCLGILAISGTSFFSSKTAVIAWFLYGVLSSDSLRTQAQAKTNVDLRRLV